MSTPLWTKNAPLPTANRLTGNLRADVCVVGAGIAGLSTAYQLARDGVDVVLLERDALGSGETVRTTAQIVTALDRGWSAITHAHGEDGARRAAESHAAAIDWLETLCVQERIECGFERLDGFLIPAAEDEPSRIADELEAARAAGVAGVALETRVPGLATFTGACVRYPRQAILDPARFVRGLADALDRHGVRAFTGVQVTEIGDEVPARIQTAQGPTVTADVVVVATNTPMHLRIGFSLKQAAYRSYVIAGAMPADALPSALVWDTADPFHYVRPVWGRDDGSAWLLVGGEDHKTGQDDHVDGDAYRRLEAWARRYFPRMGPVAASWSGQIMESMDGLAFIGRTGTRPDVYVATGDSGNGMTHGAIAGVLLTDLIRGRENPWAGLYDPQRLRPRAAGELARENLNVVRQLAAWVTPGEVADEADVAPGSGAVLRVGLSKVAVYRDPDGTLHRRSAVCPHLGCIVAWNATESSWDCPCHGSRFDCQGRVLNGPANQDLPPAGDGGDPAGEAVVEPGLTPAGSESIG